MRAAGSSTAPGEALAALCSRNRAGAPDCDCTAALGWAADPAGRAVAFLCCLWHPGTPEVSAGDCGALWEGSRKTSGSSSIADEIFFFYVVKFHKLLSAFSV